MRSRAFFLLAQLDRDPAAFTESPISVQRERIAHWADRLDDLPALIRYNSLARRSHPARPRGVGSALSNTWSEAGSRLAEAFRTELVRRDRSKGRSYLSFVSPI